MKKNWTQIATLCVVCVLLVVTISQGRQISSFQQNIENGMDNLRSDVERELSNVSSDIKREMEEANKVVIDCALEPNGIDKDTRSLRAIASVTLKEWHEDTEIVLLAKVGDNELSLPMESKGDGLYISQLSLPLEGDYQVYLDAMVSGGGLTKKETLHSWGGFSMMLPIQNSGGGWSGPVYRDGIMSSQFHITIVGQQNEKPASVRNPQILTYINGELIQTQRAIEDPSASASNGLCYTVDTEDTMWSVQCDIGDVIEVHFLCEDEYGLGYDFLFQTWVVEGETADNQASAGGSGGSPVLELYWPE